MMTVYKITSEVWIYPGMQGNWHFVSVPKKMSEKITKGREGMKRKGWGSVPVTVRLGSSVWKTSIFPDKREGVFILPLKADVRKKESVFAKDRISLTLTVET